MLTAPGDARVTERATYDELLARAETFAAGLHRAKFRPRHSVIVASPLSIDFYALAIAIVGSGMTLVLIDGRLDRRRLLSALSTARAKGIVSVPEALARWPLVPALWRARRFVVGGDPGFGTRPLGDLTGAGRRELAPGGPREVAIVSFTSGSTGRAKGVVRTNGILLAQHLALSDELPFEPGDVDMTCFPAVVLHNLACGVTTVLPPVDLREPGSVDPVAALSVMSEFGITTLSGAPSFVRAVARHAAAHGPTLPALRQIVLGGAPVSPALCGELAAAFPDAAATVVYGSTEAEPIAHVPARDVLATAAAAASSDEPPEAGLLVGRPSERISLRIVELPERVARPITAEWIEGRQTAVGEVIVHGENVSRRYVGDVEAERRNKLRQADGNVWHRTGDVARFDGSGRLRLLGRVGDGIDHHGVVIYPLPVEAELSGFDGVARAGLVATGDGPVLALELESGADAVAVGARARALLPDGIEVRVIERIPVDARHNSKVDRRSLIALLADAGR